MVKVGNFLAQDKIFQQRRAAAAGAKRILIVGDAHALIGGQRMIFAAFTKGVEGGELIIRGLGRFCCRGRRLRARRRRFWRGAM